MKDREVLEHALALLEDPSHWTQGTYARDANGQKVPLGPHAERWCAMGALLQTAGITQVQRIAGVIGAGQTDYGWPNPTMNLIQFNDHHSYEDVILVMKHGLDHLE